MNSRDALEIKKELLLSIPEESVQRPRSFSVNQYLQISEKLYATTLKDQASLVSRGLDWSVVMDIPVRVRALMESETLWQLKRKTATDTHSGKWKQAFKQGYFLFNQLINEFRFAFSRDIKLSKYVREISKRKRKADIIANLNELSELGLANTHLLEITQFDIGLLATAKEAAAELTRLWAQATTERLNQSPEKNLRNRAYTHLKEAITYVVQYGKFVFNRDRGHRAVYNISAYLTVHHQSESNPIPEPAPVSLVQVSRPMLPVSVQSEVHSINPKVALLASLEDVEAELIGGPP